MSAPDAPSSPRLFRWSSRLSSPSPSRSSSPKSGSPDSPHCASGFPAPPTSDGQFAASPEPYIRRASPQNKVVCSTDPTVAYHNVRSATWKTWCPPPSEPAETAPPGIPIWNGRESCKTVQLGPEQPLYEREKEKIAQAPAALADTPALNLVPPTPTTSSFNGIPRPNVSPAMPLKAPAGCPEPAPRMVAIMTPYDGRRLSPHYEGRS